MSAALAPQLRPQIDYAAELRLARFDTAFAQARVDGYVSVDPAFADELMQRWATWCAPRQLPIIQVWERPRHAWVSVDVVFRDQPLSVPELVRLEAAWRGYGPPAHALHGLTPLFCHFAGMNGRQAHLFAQQVSQLLVPRSLLLPRRAEG